MANIGWCIKQKKGISLIDPSSNLSDAYMKDAEDSLLQLHSISGKWAVVISYYACYNALYSLCQFCGIKSEIHDCTLSLLHIFDFSGKEITFIEQLKNDRIDVQYYLKDKPVLDISLIKSFILSCKTKIRTVQVEDMRNKLKGAQK
jgi:hypothetical protein